MAKPIIPPKIEAVIRVIEALSGTVLEVLRAHFQASGETDVEASSDEPRGGPSSIERTQLTDAEFIELAVNSHDALLAACKLANLHFKRRNASNFMEEDEYKCWTAINAAVMEAEKPNTES